MKLKGKGGLVAHRIFVKDSIESQIFQEETSDLVFICNDGSKVYGHKSIFSPVSDLLKNIFSIEKCCSCGGDHSAHTSREPQIIQIDSEGSTMKDLVTVLYKGSLVFSNARPLLTTMKALGIDISVSFFILTAGGLEELRENMTTAEAYRKYSLPQLAASAEDGHANTKAEPAEVAAPSSQGLKRRIGQPTGEEPKKKKTALELNVAMARLLGVEGTTSLPCLVENCTEMVSKQNITPHFKKHFQDETSAAKLKPNVTVRKIEPKVERKLEDFSDSSDSDETEEDTSLNREVPRRKPGPARMTMRERVELTPTKLPTASSSSFPPRDSGSKVCGSKSPRDSRSPVQVTKMIRHYNSPVSSHKIMAESQETAEKPFVCQKCYKGFRRFRELRTHYTLYHYWENLKEDLKQLKNKCNVCMKVYPSDDHLVQHMGNFHNYTDKYLMKENLYVLNEERTVKILSNVCNLCKKEMSSGSNLKSHFAQVHFKSELSREFSSSKKCPKCGKLFDHTINVVTHLGAFHDEVLKYAAGHMKMKEEDREMVPCDDFDDNTVGAPYQDPRELAGKNLLDCAKCPLRFNRLELKIHYLEEHYQEIFSILYSSVICIACGLKFKDPRATQKHIVSNHESFLVDILEKDNINLPANVKKCPPRRQIDPTEEPFNLLFCQICSMEFEQSSELKKHYIEHLKPKFSASFMTLGCSFCSMVFTRVEDNLTHMTLKHTAEFIIPYMEKQGLWVNGDLHDVGELKPKKVNVRVKKLSKHETYRHLGIPDIAQDSMAFCQMPSCGAKCNSRKEFLLHLLYVHFFETTLRDPLIEKELAADKNTCPFADCKKVVGTMSVVKRVLEHLAVEHEVVIKYLQVEVGKTVGPSITAPTGGEGSSGVNGDSQLQKSQAKKFVACKSGAGGVNAPRKKGMACKSGGGGKIIVRTPDSINQAVNTLNQQKAGEENSSDFLNKINKALISDSSDEEESE